MRYLATFTFFILFTNVLFAQITISSSDMPQVNDTIRLSETFNIQGLDAELTGANYSWDFSTLTPNTQRIDTFFSVGNTPFVYQLFFNNIFLYPNHKASYALRGQDIGIPQVSITEVFNYIKNSSLAYDNVGFGSNINSIPSSTQNNPVDREYNFPMNYGTINSSFSEYAISVPTFGHYGQTLDRNDTVDGWGTLILPNGTYDVLRIKSVLNKVDTTYLDLLGFGATIPRPEEIEYKWLATGKGVPLLKIITNAGIVTQIEYQDDPLVITSVIEKNEINDVTIFPNPTKNHLVIDFKSNVSGKLKVNLRDILGKNVAVIYTNNVISGNNKLLIDLTKYSIKKGIYFIEINIDEKQYYTEKIVIME
ncbi:MAG: T9SS type A sorting domain-containing protein [Vicingaceae bacterium]